MDTKPIVRRPLRVFFLVLFSLFLILLSTEKGRAQLSTNHWVPPVYVTGTRTGPYELVVTTNSTNLVDVIVSLGDGTVLTTTTVTSGAQTTVVLGDTGDLANCNAATTVINTVLGSASGSSQGVFVTSSEPVFVNTRHLSNLNFFSLTAKGNRGLGRRFRTGFLQAETAAAHQSKHEISVMATEPGVTNVTIETNGATILEGVSGTAPTVAFSLAQGESYIVSASADGANENDDMNGTLVTSDQDIVVNSLTWFAANSGPIDSGGDQLVPTCVISSDYLIQRGNGIDSIERGLVVADEDGTEIYRNGTLIATVDSGDFHRFDIGVSTPGSAVRVTTSKTAYLFYQTGGQGEPGLSLMPPLTNSGSQRIEFKGDIPIAADYRINVLAIAGSEVRINGGPVLTPLAVDVQNSGWDAYSEIENSTGTVTVTSTENAHVGVAYGRSGSTGGYSFFSDYGEGSPAIASTPALDPCVPGAVLSTTGFDSYQWSRDGTPIPGANQETYSPVQPGSFTVVGILAGCGESLPSLPFVLGPCSDMTPPVISCPANITTPCNTPGGAIVTFTTTATDDEDPNPQIVCLPPSGALFPFGVTTVTCTASDASGNEAQCTFEIEVQSDSFPPEIACPTNRTVSCATAAGVTVDFTVTATDVCDSEVSVTCIPPSGSLFAPGTTQVDCAASDESGNMSFCSFDVIVQLDSQAPNLGCPDPITVECTDPAGETVFFNVTATDDCDPSPSLSCNPPSGSVFPPGTTSVTCTAVDDAGNSSQCAFDVIVADTVAPNLTCAADTTVECSGPSGTPVDFVLTATDACDPAVIPTSSPLSGDPFPVGTTTVIAQATDASGNTTTCSFTVTVEDTIAPVITCPEDLVASCTEPAGAVVEFTVTATDLCDDDVEIVCDPPSGSVFVIGTTLVQCTATDNSSNQDSCSFSITVEPSILPISGSEAGGNHVNLFGCGFTNLFDTDVLFGDQPALVTSVSQDHITVRTPPGNGLVDVTLIDSNGTRTFPATFTYVDPAVAARFGNVNVGLGDREDILFLNDSAGDAERFVCVGLNQPFELRMEAPSSRTVAKYAMWAWLGFSDAGSITDFGSDIGIISMAPPFAGGNPRTTWNLLQHKQLLGCSDFPSSPAPYTFFSRPGRATPVTVTFQALVRDDATRGEDEFSISNAVILKIE